MNRLNQAVSLLVLSAAAQLSAADFLPLQPGNNWTYQDAVTGASFNVRVGTPVFVNERVYYSLRGYTQQPLLARINEYGNLVYYDDELRTEGMLTAFEVVAGATFEAHKRECPERGRALDKRGSHDGPAGRWSTLDIQYQPYACADAGDQLEQFVENIGMVRRVVNTIAGPRTFDLVYARVGNLTIQSGSRGSFGVTVAPGIDRGTWTATLRVNLNPGFDVKVKFPSSQEYDLRVRDTTGRVLWTWSADKLFLAALHEKNIGDGWTATVEIPMPPATPEGPHTYIVEAWLTTAQDEPQFAAVAVVGVPATVNAAALRTGRERP